MEEEGATGTGHNFVTCLNWVKIGIPSQHPTEVQYTREELKEIINSTRSNLTQLGQLNDIENVEMLNDDSEEPMQADQTIEANGEDAEIIDRYGLDDYEDSSDDEQRNIIGGFGNLVQHGSNEDDPYLEPDHESDEESEAEDFNLNPDDNLLLVGRVQEDASSLEVHVYNKEDNYIHHDVYLPAYPMCIETINFNSKEQAQCNWCAIGDMTKDIGIWNLDIVNELEPLTRLKGHKDAVLDLSWNCKMTNILASCSVDKSIQLWDLNSNKSIHKIKRSNRIQSLQFNSEDAGKLLIGDCDGKITLLDCNTLASQSYSIAANEIEKVLWCPNSAHNFLVSTDKGTIHLYDSRAKEELRNVQAHDDSVTDLTFSIDNLFLSASADGAIKIWNLCSNNFQLIETYTDCAVGKIFAMKTNPDFPLICAVGGDNDQKNIEIVDLAKIPAVKCHLNLPDED